MIQIPLGFFVAIGLLRGIKLAWILAVIFYLLSMVYSFISINIWLMIFSFMIIVYLSQPVIREYFDIAPKTSKKRVDAHSTDKTDARLQIKREHRFSVGIILLFSGLILFYYSISGTISYLELSYFYGIVLIVFGILLMLKINVTFP